MWGQDRDIIFVSCSATIAKPAQHMKRLFGIEVCAVSRPVLLAKLDHAGSRGGHGRRCSVWDQGLHRVGSAVCRRPSTAVGEKQLDIGGDWVDAVSDEAGDSSDSLLQGKLARARL